MTKTTTENGHTGIVYRVAMPSDRDDVLDFIRKHYYPEEPITIGNSPKKQDEADEEFSLSVIPHGVSILAIDADQNDKIVGAVLAGPIEPNESEHMIEESKRLEQTNRKWSEILLLLAHLEEQANIFERYNVEKAIHIHVMGVDPQYRGKSIGINLFEKCFDASKLSGYPLITADCTSVFSIRIAEKLAMDCIGQTAYNEYKDSTGRQVFNPPEPHKFIKTFSKFL